MKTRIAAGIKLRLKFQTREFDRHWSFISHRPTCSNQACPLTFLAAFVCSEIDLPSRHFHPRIYGVGAWTDNLPFACDLIATIKPRLLVELGTDRGESYFAFCQAVLENETATRCFAVDNWLGDPQAGLYDETTFEEVSRHNRTHYEKFSTLLRCAFDEALSRFEPESIDILHLDGLHTETAVRHDLENWLPKIAPGGLLLMHDVCVRRPEFGAWKVWQGLQTRGRSYTFSDGPGLGLWQKNPARSLPDPTETLLSPNESKETLARYYREQAQRLQAMILQHWRDGSIRETAVAHQTTVQIFHTHDGIYREEDSLVARVGHEEWKDISIALPSGAGAAPLRIDFYSTYTLIELSSIRVTAGESEKFNANKREDFAKITIAGDAERLTHPTHLLLKIVGPDPQLHLPSLALLPNESSLRVSLRLCVTKQPN